MGKIYFLGTWKPLFLGSGWKAKTLGNGLTLFLLAKGGINPYMSVTWPSPVGIGLNMSETDILNHKGLDFAI